MKNLILLLLLLLITVNSLRVLAHDEQQKRLLGGWAKADPAQADTNIDQYIRNEYSYLKDAKLVGYEKQVVSGMNYRYIYDLKGVTYRVTVWDRDWLKKRQVTELQKVEEKTNSEGKKVRVTTTTRIEERPFSESSQSLFSE